MPEEETPEKIPEENLPVLQIFVNEDQFGFDTSMDPHEAVFWLEAVKASILSRVVGETEDE